MLSQRSDNPVAACPGAAELEQYRLGELDAQRADEIERHLQGCEACWGTLEAVEDCSDPLIDALARMPCVDEDEPEFQALYHGLLDAGPRLDEPRDRRPNALDRDEELTATASADWTRPHQVNPYPERLGVYRLESCIGRGAHGAVFIARHERLDRAVAIKILQSPRSAPELAVERFLNEMRAVGKLDHPNIIRATDAGEADGFHYLVMEYIPGLDVGKLARFTPRLSVPDACEIARQAALALEFAAQHHMVHRDVKPSNLLVTWNGVVKLLDLGLVAMRQRGAGGVRQTSMPHGTADYMSPEQWTRYDAVDIRADLYSLGCTLYRLLTGRPPYYLMGSDMITKRDAHLSAAPPSLRRARPDVPSPLAEVIERLLAKDPNERWQSPAELAQALEPWCLGANLARLVAAAGVRAPLNADAFAAARRGWLGSLLLQRISRRRWLQAAALATPGLALASLFMRGGDVKRPALKTGIWRPLAPAENSLVVDKSGEATFTALLGGLPGIELASIDLAVLKLGAALQGRFQYRCRVKAVEPDSAGGIFLRYHRAKVSHAMRHSFVALEWTSHPKDESKMQFSWKQYAVFETDRKSALEANRSTEIETTPSADLETDREWSVNPQVWAVADVPKSWPSNSDASAEHTLSVECGLTGIPEVLWDGKSLSLYTIPWEITEPGRQMALMLEELLPHYYGGRLGVYVAKGAMEFRNPELRYET